MTRLLTAVVLAVVLASCTHPPPLSDSAAVYAAVISHYSNEVSGKARIAVVERAFEPFSLRATIEGSGQGNSRNDSLPALLREAVAADRRLRLISIADAMPRVCAPQSSGMQTKGSICAARDFDLMLSLSNPTFRGDSATFVVQTERYSNVDSPRLAYFVRIVQCVFVRQGDEWLFASERLIGIS